MYQKKLDPEMDLNEYFDSGDYSVVPMGKLLLPSGKLVASDPLYHLEYGNVPPFSKRVPRGQFLTEVAVAQVEDGEPLYAAARILFSDRPAVRYQLALRPGEHVSELAADEIYGLPVESGLACFCDEKTARLFAVFCAQWRQDHPGKNLYDDYFAFFFARSARKCPGAQRPEGSFLNWHLPDVKENVVLFDSGFGNGVYPAYWSFDEEGKVVSLVLQMISPAELEDEEE
jgi:hypothetical protein